MEPGIGRLVDARAANGIGNVPVLGIYGEIPDSVRTGYGVGFSKSACGGTRSPRTDIDDVAPSCVDQVRVRSAVGVGASVSKRCNEPGRAGWIDDGIDDRRNGCPLIGALIEGAQAHQETALGSRLFIYSVR